MRGARIPALTAPEDFPQLLGIGERQFPPGPRHLHGPDQDSGLLPVAAIDANIVAVHGSPMTWRTGRTQRFRHGRPLGYESSAERLTDCLPIRKKNGEGGLRGKPFEIPKGIGCYGRGSAGVEIRPWDDRARPLWTASRRKAPRRGPTTTSSDNADRRRGLRPPVPDGCDRP